MQRFPSARPRTSHRDHRCAGFTMVEMMVAIGVLLVAALAAFSSQMASMQLVSTSRDTDAAVSDLQACMEQVLVLPLDEIPVPGSEFAAGQPVAAFQNLHLRNERIVCNYPDYAGGTVPDPLEIVLTATWSDPKGRTRTETMRTLKVR